MFSGQTKNARRKHELESFTDARSLSEHENLSDMKEESHLSRSIEANLKIDMPHSVAYWRK